jgi:monothiol glutaredoxin
MPRQLFDETHIHTAIRSKISNYHHTIVLEVMGAIKDNDVVVVGMGLNPFPKKARTALDLIKQPYKYLEYGNYFNNWKRRNALKMWCGWPTFPMVFVKGTLVGGANDLQALIDNGELNKLLSS